MKPNHMIICAVLLVAGVILLATGAGAFAVLPILLCGTMMGGMMWMMMRPRGSGRGND